MLQHQPNSASARLRRAVVCTQLHDEERALADFDVALWLRPGPAQAYGARAAIHERQLAYEAALADLDAAIKLAPERADYRERQRRLKNRLSAERWRSVFVRPATWTVPWGTSRCNARGAFAWPAAVNQVEWKHRAT